MSIPWTWAILFSCAVIIGIAAAIVFHHLYFAIIPPAIVVATFLVLGIAVVIAIAVGGVQ